MSQPKGQLFGQAEAGARHSSSRIALGICFLLWIAFYGAWLVIDTLVVMNVYSWMNNWNGLLSYLVIYGALAIFLFFAFGFYMMYKSVHLTGTTATNYILHQESMANNVHLIIAFIVVLVVGVIQAALWGDWLRNAKGQGTYTSDSSLTDVDPTNYTELHHYINIFLEGAMVSLLGVIVSLYATISLFQPLVAARGSRMSRKLQ